MQPIYWEKTGAISRRFPRSHLTDPQKMWVAAAWWVASFLSKISKSQLSGWDMIGLDTCHMFVPSVSCQEDPGECFHFSSYPHVCLCCTSQNMRRDTPCLLRCRRGVGDVVAYSGAGILRLLRSRDTRRLLRQLASRIFIWLGVICNGSSTPQYKRYKKSTVVYLVYATEFTTELYVIGQNLVKSNSLKGHGGSINWMTNSRQFQKCHFMGPFVLPNCKLLIFHHVSACSH